MNKHVPVAERVQWHEGMLLAPQHFQVQASRLDSLVDNRLAAYVQAHNLFRSKTVEIDHLTLFSSLLGKEAAVYTAEVAYPLA